jgi:hypothetical protein
MAKGISLSQGNCGGPVTAQTSSFILLPAELSVPIPFQVKGMGPRIQKNPQTTFAAGRTD